MWTTDTSLKGYPQKGWADLMSTPDSVAILAWPIACVPTSLSKSYLSQTILALPRSLITSNDLPMERISTPGILSILCEKSNKSFVS